MHDDVCYMHTDGCYMARRTTQDNLRKWLSCSVAKPVVSSELSSIPGQSTKMVNVPMFYHEANMVL